MPVSKNNRKASVRCPWCSRQPVATKRGRIVSHLSPGGVKCVGAGQPAPIPIPPAPESAK